jgi:hypothetical protein
MVTNPSLQSRFKGQMTDFTVVDLDLQTAASLLEEFLAQFGPTSRANLQGMGDIAAYLGPRKSFPKRYVLVYLNGWTFLFNDMKDCNCYVEGYALSRLSKCRAFGMSLYSDRREMHVFDDGGNKRKILSLLDGDRWYYLEMGDLRDFENKSDGLKRRKKDRLTDNSKTGSYLFEIES